MNTNSAMDPDFSLCQLLDPDVLANPYPLYERLRGRDAVLWDPFLHAWIVTDYADCLAVLHKFSADRIRTPETLREMGCEGMTPIAGIMTKQLIFMDAPNHTRLRTLCAAAFSPSRVEQLKGHISEIAEKLIDAVLEKGTGRMDLIVDFAEILPAIVTAEMLGVPTSDHLQLKDWSADLAEMLGNLQHNCDRAPRLLQSIEDMTTYFRDAIREKEKRPTEGLVYSLMTAEVDGGRLTEEEVIANSILTMIGGQETTTNLMGNGMLALLRNPDQMNKLKGDDSIVASAVEELLRYDAPVQHTARIVPEDQILGGKQLKKGQSIVAVIAAGNRDPQRFADPNRLDLERKDNRHLSFGWAAHFCFGAALARIEGQIAFSRLLTRLGNITQVDQPLEWRENLGLRGLKSLPLQFDGAGTEMESTDRRSQLTPA